MVGTFYFSWKKKGGTKFFKGGPILSENIGPPGPFFSEIFGSGGPFWGGGTNCYVTDLKARRRPRGTLQLETRRGGTSDLATSIR